MNSSDETLKKPLENDAVLQAIANLSKNVVAIAGDLRNLSDRFDSLEGRFDKLESRFDRVDDRFNKLETRFDKLEDRFGKLEGRFDKLETRFDKLEGRFDKLETRFDVLENFVTVQFEAVREGIEYNSARYDRMEAKFFDVRSDVSNMRADIKDLTQVIRKKEFV